MRTRKLPKFKSEGEEARFWAAHSPLDYADEYEDVDEVIALAPALERRIRERMKKRLVAIRLEEWQIARTKELAAKKHLPYQVLLRQWISSGIRTESGGSRRPGRRRAL